MRFYAPLLVALALPLTAPLAAQYTETLEVRVLELEATVVDRDQNAVEGLTRDDFAVTIDGQPAEVTNFSTISRGTIRDDGATAAMPVPTRLIIVVDDLHLHQEPKQRALRALRKYVDDTMDASTTATLIAWNGALVTLTTPTTRRDILHSAIEASAREMPRGLIATTERRQLQNVRSTAAFTRMAESYAHSRAIDAKRTLEALGEVVAKAAAAIEGRKIVLLVSEGIPIQPGSDVTPAMPGTTSSRILTNELSQGQRFRALAKRAQDAGVVFTTIDPSTSPETFQHEGVTILARETGGTLVANQNDLDRALARLDERLSTYYSLAVRPPQNAPANPKIEVRVKDQPKLRVHVATRSGLRSQDEAIANAVRAQLSWRNEENPLHARLFVSVQQHERGCIASLQFLVPRENLTLVESASARGQLDFWFSVVDESGTESNAKMQSLLITAKHGATIGHSMPLALSRHDYVISTAIVDRLSGTISYLQRDVECGT